ncbi:MAG: DUF3365 domain-containing protein [Scytonematopsis contorta HA4267-MV1]|jgi:methyl-accepting chemotaxis protein|nr:DUF3365 domain-containing protein [Scytonematopsis contorta HA4267-MV1]
MLINFSQPLKNLALAQKLTVLLLVIFIGGISLSGVALANILNYKAQNEITSQASLLFHTLNSVRDYTNTEVTPRLSANLNSNQFAPQTIPSYSSRRVFEKLRERNNEYQNFSYKEAMLNPTNINDLADNFEKQIIQKLSGTNNLQETSGFRSLGREKYFYIARPLSINDASCLRCHSSPEIAPKEMVQLYGNKNGFNWKLNTVLGTQMVSVPTNDILQKAYQSWFLVMGIVTVIFALAIYFANFWLRRYVVKPIKRVVRVAEAVSTGDMEADFGSASKDEVGSLVEAFTRMKISLVMAIRRLEQSRADNR